MRDDLIAQLEQAVDHHGLLRSGDTVLVAVSGGLDSVVLLDLLARLAPRRGLALTVAHLDHGLREDGRADEALVRTLAAERDLPLIAERGDVRSARRSGDSPEEALRELRRAFLEAAARRCGARRIALGHHRDDRLEWLLLRLLSGVPPDGWSTPIASGPYVRPLAERSRVELRAYARMRGLSWREDPSNDDLAVPRNRVRHRVLPALEREWGPGLRTQLAHALAAVERDRAHLDAAAEELGACARDGTGLVAAALAAAAPALSERVLGRWLLELGVEPRRVHVAALARLAASGREGGGLDLARTLRVELRAGRLVPRRAPAD